MRKIRPIAAMAWGLLIAVTAWGVLGFLGIFRFDPDQYPWQPVWPLFLLCLILSLVALFMGLWAYILYRNRS